MQQAILRRNPTKGLICHLDRGSQYAGNDFKAILALNEFIGSMSRKGDCWDKAVAESFFRTLKFELVRRNKFRTRDEAKRRTFEYVEIYYNRKRAHLTLGNLGPFEILKKSFYSRTSFKKERNATMKKELVEYFFALRDATSTTHQAEDRPIYESYLLSAAVQLALIETNAGKDVITDAVTTHERLWGHTWLQDPICEKPTKVWEKAKKCLAL